MIVAESHLQKGLLIAHETFTNVEINHFCLLAKYSMKPLDEFS